MVSRAVGVALATVLACAASANGTEQANPAVTLGKPVSRPGGVGRLNSEATPLELHRIANNASVAREERAAAIFSLFAKYLQPPVGAAAVAKVLNGEKWLNEASLEVVDRVAGWVPVKMNFGDSVFCLYLFPRRDGWSDCVIYFRLSGPCRTVDEARAFLRGAGNLKDSPKLVEFALCFYPEGQLWSWTGHFPEKESAVVP